MLTLFPFAGLARRRALRQRWSARLLAIVGIELRVSGEPLESGALLVANHVSWLDIFVINALTPAAFVSKAEVRSWPAIGWLAAKNDTLFLHRGSRGHARIVSREIGAVLATGQVVALFPEGTTTDGSHVLHFHGALLQPALDARAPIQAVALRYRDAHGHFTRAPAYWGDMTLMQCIANIVAAPAIVAEVILLPPVRGEADVDRRALAAALRERIVSQVTLKADAESA
ncbi:lysophospholipid acyltransferase family protein [Pseudazoarcus pumilus]|uniref:lysophospholipid acyltransferase family protein n=1 Tax=Pseudazoarcus pumilus TaxID=2067960 RepID=UPI001D170379|nr:lysophospholipid acyltransferase family protein [Pseudazoarcus pumilus]